MHLNHDAVGTCCGCGAGHGSHQTGLAGGMAGIHHNGKMTQLMQNGHCGQVQGIAGLGLKGTDAPLTEYDVLIALAHDILRAHQKLLEGVGQAPL